MVSSPSEISSRPGDHPQGRRLAAARGADEHDEFLFLHLKVDPVDDLQSAVFLDDAL